MKWGRIYSIEDFRPYGSSASFIREVYAESKEEAEKKFDGLLDRPSKFKGEYVGEPFPLYGE